MRDYAKLLEHQTSSRIQGKVRVGGVKNVWNLKIKSTKAFQPDDALLIKDLVAKAKQSQVAEEARKKESFVFGRAVKQVKETVTTTIGPRKNVNSYLFLKEQMRQINKESVRGFEKFLAQHDAAMLQTETTIASD